MISDEDVERIARRVIEMQDDSERIAKRVIELQNDADPDVQEDRYSECYNIEEKEFTKNMSLLGKLKYLFCNNDDIMVLAAVRYYNTYGVELLNYGDIDKELVRDAIKMMEDNK